MNNRIPIFMTYKGQTFVQNRQLDNNDNKQNNYDSISDLIVCQQFLLIVIDDNKYMN